MKPQDFFDLVREMRSRQIAWYTDHRRSDLIEAKQLERQVDAALREGFDPDQPDVQQLDFFEGKQGR